MDQSKKMILMVVAAVIITAAVVGGATSYVLVNNARKGGAMAVSQPAESGQLLNTKGDQPTQQTEDQMAQKSEQEDNLDLVSEVLSIDTETRTIENPNAQFTVTYPRDVQFFVDEKYGLSITKATAPTKKDDDTNIRNPLTIKTLGDKNLDVPKQLFAELGLQGCKEPEKMKNDTLYVECEEELFEMQKQHNYFKKAAQLVWFSFMGDKKDWDSVLTSFTVVQ